MMRLRLFLIFMFLTVFVIIVKSQEYRAEAGVSYEIVNLKLNAAFHGRRIERAYESNNVLLSQLSVKYKFGKNFDLGSSIRYAIDGEVSSFNENTVDYDNKTRATFDFGSSLKRFENDIKLKNRLRYQVNFNSDGEVKNYIREKISLDYKLTDFFSPYIEAELYFNVDENELKTYRLYFGSEFEFEKNNLDFFFIAEVNHNENVELFYIMGLAYQFSIN